MSKLYYDVPTHLAGRDCPPTDFGGSPTDIAPDQASQHMPTSASTRPSFDDSTGGREKVGSAAGVVVTRLLAVLVAAMVLTSILGFTLFDRQGGNSATALASLAIGGSAAVLGMILGFRQAHQAARDESVSFRKASK
jgi:hypothetical protein